jgi:hypothetical protein
VVSLFTLPFRFLKWTFTNGLKGIIVLVVVIVLLLIGYFTIRHYIDESMNQGKPPVTASTEITAGLPTSKEAPYQVLTWSRTYYAVKAVKNKDGTVILTDYWQVLNKKWVFTKGTFKLDESFGTLTVKKR